VQETILEPQVAVDPLPHPEEKPAEEEQQQQQQEPQQQEPQQQEPQQVLEEQPMAQPTLVKLPSNVVSLPQMPKPDHGSGPAMFDRPAVRVVALYLLPSGYECASILGDNFSKALGALLSAYVPSVEPDVQVGALRCPSTSSSLAPG
jgi:FtsZ-interacting cell division protein YlmF